MKFSIKDLFSKCDQIRGKLRTWSHLLNKPLMETSFFVQRRIFHLSVIRYQMTVSYQKIKHILQKQNYHILILRMKIYTHQ